MSVTANYSGNLERIVSQIVATTTKTLIVEPIPDNSMTVAGWWACNDTAAAIIVQLYYYNLIDNVEYLVWVKSVPAHDTLGSPDTPIRLRQGDEMRVKAATGITLNLNILINLSANR